MTRNSRGSKALLSYLTRDEVARRLAARGGYLFSPAAKGRKHALNEYKATLQQIYGPKSQVVDFFMSLAGKPQKKALRSRYTHPDIVRIRSGLENSMGRFLSGEISADELQKALKIQ